MKSPLPKFILVVSIVRYTDNAELVDVLKDYFTGVPYIDITDYELNKQTIHYILYESHIIKKVAYTLWDMRDKFKILDYSYYTLNHNSTMYHRIYAHTIFAMPDKIAADSISTQLQLWNTV